MVNTQSHRASFASLEYTRGCAPVIGNQRGGPRIYRDASMVSQRQASLLVGNGAGIHLSIYPFIARASGLRVCGLVHVLTATLDMPLRSLHRDRTTLA